MNISEVTNLPELLLKLCNHLGKNDPEITEGLSKTAFSFLSTSTSANYIPVDEQCIVQELKLLLESNLQSENADAFQLLYMKLCSSNILQNRCSTLSFMLELAKLSQKENSMKWATTVESLDKFPSLLKFKSNFGLNRINSQESIRSIFPGRGATIRSLQSSTTTISHSFRPASTWSKTDLDAASGLPTSKSSLSVELINEKELLQEVIYTFQGIEGSLLRKEPGGLGFIIDPKAAKNLSQINRSLIDRLLGISFLHNQLKQFCENNDNYSGIICQALVATLREELLPFYKTIAILQAALNEQIPMHASKMTLRKALVYTHDHRARFEWLAYIGEQCADKRGGELVSAVHGFLHHGSRCAQEVAKKMLTAVCKPWYIMLSRWLLDGEINDPCNEFFIEARDISGVERLWHDKYHVRRSMVPSFITMDQANKILATGKSINFLREICKDHEELPGRDVLLKLSTTGTAEALFAPEQSLEFDSTLDKIYKETSLRVLDLLKDKYRLMEHLQSLRRYLLLGQGDFIRHLLELLLPELNKPAQEIYGHTLSAILESAIRVTGAQFEDEDTLLRLNVSFMGHSAGDNGWDVFSLVYIVDGPVGTIFQPTMSVYRSLFGALWKAKRMEFALANMRKQQIAMAKSYRRIKELKPVMHCINVLTSKMIHFLHETQYYCLFEVLECSWAEMVRRVGQAECLDDIISAHNTFLSSVQCGVLLDEDSRELFAKLRSIYNFILTLEGHQEALCVAATDEFNAYMALQEAIQNATDFGRTNEEQAAADERAHNFRQFLLNIKTKVKYLAESYEAFVKEYLVLLSSSSNMNLQLLSVRLSFNGYYKVI